MKKDIRMTININKEDILHKAYKKCWINKNRRVYWDRNKKRRMLFSHFVWNLYHPDDEIKYRDGYNIHHKDENTLNDHPYNLEKLLRGKHVSNHNSGENHPFYGKKRPEHSEKMKSRNTLAYGKFGKDNPNYGNKWSEEQKKNMSKIKKEYYEERS